MSEFKLIEENVNALRLSDDTKFYDYNVFKDLVESAEEVHGLSVFSNYKVPEYSTFVPFIYQKNAVDTMLIDFEGRGVFGDQVGLGKTIEALMSAHIMFCQKEIKNCLIVCPANLIEQWVGEIEKKFRDKSGECVFDIRLKKSKNGRYITDGNMNMHALKEQINDTENKDLDRLPVFFISNGSLTSSANIDLEAELAAELEQKESDIAKLTKAIDEKELEISRLLNPQEDFVRDELERYKGVAFAEGRNIEEFYPPVLKANKEITDIKAQIAKLTDEIDATKKASLWQSTIDLLIVDEVDTIVSNAVTKIVKYDDHDNTQLQEKKLEKAKAVLDSLLKIQKKYCFLISATPLRAQLEDIYYLTKIVNETRFPDLDSFYNYVGARSLDVLVTDNSNITRLTGLINTMFTRNRMDDDIVKESYKPSPNCSIGDIVDAVLNNNLNAGRKIYKGLTDREIKSRVSRIMQFVNNEINIMVKHTGNQGTPEKLFNAVRENYVNMPIYVTLIMKGLYSYYNATRDVYIHNYIDWSRQKKNGNCINVGGNDIEQNQSILERIGEMHEKVVIFKGKLSNRRVLYDIIRKKFPDRKVFADIDEDDFMESVIGDAQIAYSDDWKDDDSESYDETTEAMTYRKFKEIPKNNRYKAFKRWNKNEFIKADVDYSDAIYLVDYTRREGSNLNCASHLIICEMVDYAKGRSFIDPLRFEQIIGRLNRVGQMNNIHVDVYVDSEKEHALYDLYADEDGLAMVGTGRAEVSFVVPIVTAIFKNYAKNDKGRGPRFWFSELKAPSGLTDIFDYCYEEDYKENNNRKYSDGPRYKLLKSTISEMCKLLMKRVTKEAR